MGSPEFSNPVQIETRRAESADPDVEINGGEYPVSEVERIIEKMCPDFDTWLLKARLHTNEGTKLTRLSQPVNITSPETGSNHLLQIQWTRFSPRSGDISELERAYSGKGIRINHPKHLQRKISKHHNRNPDYFLQVADKDYFPQISIEKWQEKVNFALFNIDDLPELPFRQPHQPFNIFNPNSTIYHSEIVGGIKADVHITFHQNPVFKDVPQSRSGRKIQFRFPSSDLLYRQAINNALLSGNYPPNHPFKLPDGIHASIKENMNEFNIHQDVPQEDVFRLIQDFINTWTIPPTHRE